MEIFQVNDIFTPSSPAKANFVEREVLNKRIVRGLQTKGMQVIVYGQSGSGKTTLLENKLFQVYPNHLKTSCMNGSTFNSVILDAFDQLAPYYIDQKEQEEEISIDATIKASYQIISNELKSGHKNRKKQLKKRALPPQLTAQNLARFMGESGLCWVLDDFHKVEDKDKAKLSQLMKIFMDMSPTYPDLKVICVGAVNSARQVVQYDEEMRNRISEIKVPLMTKDEIQEVVQGGFHKLNIGVKADSIYDDIYHHSNGLASICHKLCLLMCEHVNVYQTVDYTAKIDDVLIGSEVNDWEGLDNDNDNDDDLSDLGVDDDIEEVQPTYQKKKLRLGDAQLGYAVQEYLDDTSDTIKSSFDLAFQVDAKAEFILEALSDGDEEGENIEAIFSTLKGMGISLGQDKISSILSDLQSDTGGSIVVLDINNNMYRYTNPFLMAFARTLFESHSYNHNLRRNRKDLMDFFDSTYKTMKVNL